MAVERYFNQQDINKYSVYNNTNIIKKQTTNSLINSTVNFAKNEHLEAVIYVPEQKIEEKSKKTEQQLFYIFGQNNIDLTAKFFTSGGYDVVRKQDDNNSEIITLGVVQTHLLSQYSKFNMQSVCYYMLASERIILSANINKGQNYQYINSNQVIISHNLFGIIDFSVRQLTDELSASYELDVNNNVIDNCNLQLELDNQHDYQVIVWKIDPFRSQIYKNVFTTYEYSPSEADWGVYSNDQQYQLGLNYRFSFIGYIVQHSTLINKKDLVITEDVNNLSTTVASGANQLLPFAKTLNKHLKIQKNFSYVINDNQEKVNRPLTHLLKVLVPNFQRYDNIGSQCQSIFIYSSIFSETVFFENENRESEIFIHHKLNGKVKIAIRNLRNDLYKTYYVNDSTIKIEFLFVQSKLMPSSGLVDLFLIWSKDNNEI